MGGWLILWSSRQWVLCLFTLSTCRGRWVGGWVEEKQAVGGWVGGWVGGGDSSSSSSSSSYLPPIVAQQTLQRSLVGVGEELVAVL